MLEKVRGLPKAIGRVVEKPSFPATKNKQRNWRNDIYISLPFLPKLSKLDSDLDTHEHQKNKLNNNNHVLENPERESERNTSKEASIMF